MCGMIARLNKQPEAMKDAKLSAKKEELEK
jgi:hypothetical protein